MRNVFAFIIKNHFFFLFLLLEAVCTFLIVSNNKFQRASFMNSSNAVAASILKVSGNIKEYLNLKSANKLLAAENEKLLTQSMPSYIKYFDQELLMNDTIYKQKYTYVNANVVNNSIYRRNNYLTLNKGNLNGISPEMAVIGSNGIVGIVKDVSANYCTAISLLHKESRISGKLKNTGFFGSVIWEGDEITKATLIYIPKHVELHKGDTIVTSGYSAIFPEGIMIGTIGGFNIGEQDDSYTIEVNLSTDFGSLSYVYIIKNIMKEEQQSIELKQEEYDQ